MENIEIYSSKKKSFLLLIASLLFVIGGIYMFIHAADFTSYRSRGPIFINGIGILAALFFELGIYVDILKPLITSFQNGVQLIRRHFDHINLLTINCRFVNPTTQIGCLYPMESPGQACRIIRTDWRFHLIHLSL